MRKVLRTTVTCALPGCGKEFELTRYQLDHRKNPPTCSRLHARLLPSLARIRVDEAGRFLTEQKLKAGGHEALAHFLGWHRTTLQLLERTPGRIPKHGGMRDLARVSGRPVEDIRRIFGPRIDPRTTAIIAAVRERFPSDCVRLSVVDRIEREHMTVRAYAAAVVMDEETLRVWLTGRHDYLEEPALRAIAAHENLLGRLVAKVLRKAKRHWGKALTRARRKRLRKKHHPPKPAGFAEKVSSNAQSRWDNPAWREQKGEMVLRAIHDGRRRAWADEERFLKHLVKREIGHFTKYYTSAKPDHVLRILWRILQHHRQRFPDSPLTFEALPEKVQTITEKPLHALIRASGHPHSAGEIATFIRLLSKDPRPKPFWEEASLRLYGTRDKPESARRRWAHMRRSIPGDLLRRLAGAILRLSITPDRFQDMLRIDTGRPPASR